MTFCFSALFQVFELTEDYDKAIIPYQTKTFALNVTAEINLRSFKLQKKCRKLFSVTSRLVLVNSQEHPVCEGS